MAVHEATPGKKRGSLLPATVIHPPRGAGARTLCVLGAPRGGTTMVAGLLRNLGVYMGEDLAPGTTEDRAFTSHRGMRNIFTDVAMIAQKRAYLAQVAKLIEARNGAHQLWGWKDPIAISYLADIYLLLRSPHFVFVTRDPGAVAQREMMVQPTSNVLAHLKGIVSAYSRTVDFLAGRSAPTLMLSYERTLRNPRAAAAALMDFVGVQKDGYEDWAADFVSPSPASYEAAAGDGGE
jgi:hypothetical protein